MSSIIGLLKNPAPEQSRRQLIKHAAVEFVATTIFIYFGTLSAVSTGVKLGNGTGVGAHVARIFPIAFSFGISIMCLAYSIGHITGGHMNPAVTLLMFLQRKISFCKLICYWLAQFVGSLLASSLVWGSTNELQQEIDIFGSPPYNLGATTLDSKISTGNGFLLELMGSFFFYLVISQTALDENGIAKTSFPAIPIGFSLVVVHICLIPFTGCGVNPARTFGPAVITCMSAEGDCGSVIGDWWWIYYVAPFLAAFLVAEITALMKWDVDSENEEKESAGNSENKEKASVENSDIEKGKETPQEAEE